MAHVHERHEKIFAHLKKKNDADPSFRFTTRQTNRYGRLDKGYWFHGNDNYLVVSFWSGTDWMNKTPNIMFSTDFEDCYLEITVWDSDLKREFVDKYLVGKIEKLEPGGKYVKWLNSFSEDTILDVLDEFITNEKEIIDNAIRQNEKMLADDDSNILGFISANQFEWALGRIEEYREWKNSPSEPEVLATLQESKVRTIQRLKSIRVNMFPGLTGCQLDEIPVDTRCIFLTGENGTGKTSFLKALGCALTNDHESLINGGEYSVALEMHGPHDIVHFESIRKTGGRRLNIDGYAAYGPYRLMTNSDPDVDKSVVERMNIYNYSLFESAPILFDIDHGIRELLPEEDNVKKDYRRSVVSSVIRDMIPGFRRFVWNNEGQTLYKVGYADSAELLEESESQFDEKKMKDNEQTRLVTYGDLPTGAKSVISMVGDMMIRLFYQQPEVADISELTGIVLIDEIDIHLHPIFQKSIVQQLTDNFPKVQFVISTHSPIPILGAPKDSCIYRIKRNENFQVHIERMDDKVAFRDLLPNTLLTSPIFNLDDITSSHHDPENLLRVEDSFERMQLNVQLERDIESFITNEREDRFIRLFNKKDDETSN